MNTNPKVNLDNLFAPHSAEVKRIGTELAGTLSLAEKTAEEHFTSYLNSAIEQTVQEGRMKAGAPNRESIQMQLDESHKRREEREANYSSLKNQKAKHLANAEDCRSPWIYMAIYGILLIAMFAAAGWTAEMLFAEQGRVLAWITSFVFIGGSYLVNNLYWGKPDEERLRFFNRLNWIGLIFFIGVALSFAIGRGVSLLDLHQTQSNSGNFSLRSQSKGDALEIWQYGSTITAFIFTVFLELCFGSTMLISIQKRLKPRIDLANLEGKIRKTEADIEAEMTKASNLAAQLEEIDNFDAYQKAWAEQTRSVLMADFHLKMAKAKEEAIQRLLTRDRSEIAIAEAILSQPSPKPIKPNGPNGGGKSHEPQDISNNGNKRDGDHPDQLPF